jgi:general secretion pathway protein H
MTDRAGATRCGSLMSLAGSVFGRCATGWSPANGRRDSPAHGEDDAGFTLIEMIVVLGILAAMVGLVLSRAPLHGGRLDLDAAAQEVAESLRLARSQAIAANHAVFWTADPAGFGAEGNLPHKVNATVIIRDAGAIVFAGDGSSSGGLVFVRSGDRNIGIDVDWLTGRVWVGDR